MCHMINKYSFFFRKKRIKICCKFKRFFFSRSYILPWPPRTATGMDGTLPHCQLKEEQEEQKEDQSDKEIWQVRVWSQGISNQTEWDSESSLEHKGNHNFLFWLRSSTKVIYTKYILQTIQMRLILLCVWAELAVLGSTKTALKFI